MARNLVGTPGATAVCDRRGEPRVPPVSLYGGGRLMAARFVLEGTRQNSPQLVLQIARRGLVPVDFRLPAAGPSLRQRDILSGPAQESGGRFLLAH